MRFYNKHFKKAVRSQSISEVPQWHDFLCAPMSKLLFIIWMSAEQQAIGIMEGAFFVPKGDLINWVNNLLDLEITCI